jgi:hypothetical protein
MCRRAKLAVSTLAGLRGAVMAAFSSQAVCLV